MPFYLGIGGTGVRCAKAIVFLSALGVFKFEEPIYMFIIDPDSSNGNVDELIKIIAYYKKLRSYFHGATSMFTTDIELLSQHPWTPVAGNIKLYDFFDGEILENVEANRDILKLLYRDGELDFPLNVGFRGRPAVGVAAMTTLRRVLTGENFDDEGWKNFNNKLRGELDQRGNSKVFLVASIFGGTGASGFPTCAKLIRERYINFQGLELGGLLVLPYFQIPPPKNGKNYFFVKSENFGINTKAALLHYSYIWKDSCPFNAIYFLGDETRSERVAETFSAGGSEQKNRASYIEILAASAFYHFIKRRDDGKFEKKPKYFYAGYHDERRIKPSSFPELSDGLEKELRYNLITLQMFKEFFYPLLIMLRDEPEIKRLIPWLFKVRHSSRDIEVAIERFGELLFYYNSGGQADDIFGWLNDIHETVPVGKVLELGIYTLVRHEKLDGLTKIRAGKSLYDFVWDYLLHAKFVEGNRNIKTDRIINVEPTHDFSKNMLRIVSNISSIVAK